MGLLTSVESMKLFNIDISSIPEENMSALCSVVTDYVRIYNVTGDVIPVLNSLQQCRELRIGGMTLDTDATRAMVTAMTHGVERVALGEWVSLEISVLTQYDGNGKCSKVECQGRSYEKYWDNIRQWANTVGWNANTVWWNALLCSYVDRNEKP